MKEGHHVIGHSILESWEKTAAVSRAGEPLGELIARAARDVRLLVSLLDADAALNAALAEGYTAAGAGPARRGLSCGTRGRA